MRLQQKVLAVGLPAAIAAGAVLATVSRRATESIMIREAAQRVLPQAEDAAVRIAPAAATGREDLLLPRVQAVQAFSGAAYAAVLSPEGRVLVHTNVLEKGRRRDDLPARRAIEASAPFSEEAVEQGRRRVVLGVPIWRAEDDFLLSGKDRARVGTLLLSLPLDAALDSARRAGRQIVLLVLIFCAAALAGALGTLRLILRRLRAVAEATTKVANGDYSVSVPAGSSDELGDLAGAFNNMSGVLSRTVVSRDRLEETLSVARATLEASADGILVVSSDMRIVTYNRRFIEMWGLTDEIMRESDNRRVVELVTPMLADPAAFLEKATFNYKDFEIGEQRDVLRLKDGRVFERISRPYRLDGAAVGRTLTFRDLTPFMEAERVKGEFMANVSHELRTPLNAVVGAAGLLRGTRLDAEQQESVETLSHAAQSLLDLIDDVLDFSKIEADRMTMERAVMRPAAVLLDAAALIAPAAAEKRLDFKVDAVEAAGLVAIGDPGRLRQVLLNMLSNAVKFTDSGSIAAELKVRPLGEPFVELEFSVRDTGIGISDDQRGKLFAPFAQADGSTTRRYGGTGLGLAISKSLAGLMGGEFGFESEPGRGSRFWLKVPLERADASSGAEAPPPLPLPTRARDHLRVLVVEDNAINRRLLVRQFARLGCAADAASNGEEALEVLNAAEYGLVIMDCQMPGTDGLATTAEIRRREAGRRRVPIVAFTANATEGDRRRCLESGMDDFMAKPATLESLFRALERWDLPFDEAVYKSFIDVAGAGAGDEARLMAEFADDAATNISAARAAFARGDRAAGGRAAHSLKGACGAVGARGLRELARRVEEAAKLAEADVDPLLSQAEAELGRLKGRIPA